MRPLRTFVPTGERLGQRWLPSLSILLVILSVPVLSTGRSAPLAEPSDDPVQLRASFTFSGTFVPAPIDSNRDGLNAEHTTCVVDGRLEGASPGKLQNLSLTSYTVLVEYGLLHPSDACTSCFRVRDGDYSVEEDAYLGPIAHLIRPIRDPLLNPSSSPYSAEEWSSFYRLSTGELIFTHVTDLQICVENVQPPESLVPICHVKQTEKIVGGTGRFKHATGNVSFSAIAPSFTTDAPLISGSGCIDPSQPPPSFGFGPIHGAGQMSLEVPLADLK